jgi:hypothetical protein
LNNENIIAVVAEMVTMLLVEQTDAAIGRADAYWRDETSALPDIEACRAVMPSLASVSGRKGSAVLLGVCLCYGSPF